MLISGPDAASDLSSCDWGASTCPFMPPCWSVQVYHEWNKHRMIKKPWQNFLEHEGLSADSGSPISLSSTIPSMGRDAGTVRKLFGRSIWIWLIDNWSVCKLVRPEPTITSCEQVCVREGSRLLHFIRQILSVPLPGCLLLKAGFNRKIKRACFIWHFIHQRPGGWGGWGGKSSAMMIQSLSVMFSRLPFPSFLLTGFHTTCLILSHRMLTISQLQKSFHSLFQRPQWAKEFQFIISR